MTSRPHHRRKTPTELPCAHVQAATRFWFDLIEKNCYAEAMFPRRHRAGGSVYHPAHNLAEEWKASGFLGPRLSCASRAVAAVRIGLILMVVGFRAVAQEDPQRFLFVKTWVGTFTRSFQNSGDGTTSDGCAVLWSYQHSADVTAHLVGDTASPPLRDWYSTTYDSKQVVLRERATTTCGDFTFEVTAKETDPLLSSGGPALFVNTQDGIYSVSFPGFIDAEMTIKSGGEGKSPGQAEWWTNFVTLPLPAVGYQLNGTAK